MGGKQRHIELIGRGVLIEDGRVLLCRNRRGGYYYLPGGHVEFGESAAQAVAREFKEETGLMILVDGCGLITEGSFETDGKAHHEINVVFHVERVGGRSGDDRKAPASLEKEIDFEFIDLAAIVSTDLRPLAIRAWLASGGPASPTETGCAWVSEIDEPG